MASLRRIAAVTLGAATVVSAQHQVLGGYHPVSNVIEHAQMVYDVEAITLATNAGAYAEAKLVYTDGRNSCKSPSSTRPLQGFVSMDTYTKKLKDTVFGCSFTSSPCGPSEDSMKVGLGSGRLELAGDFWDKLIIGALDGTGDFAGKSDAMRKTAVNKGVLGVLTMYSAYELEAAITKAFNNETEDTQAAHAWDEGWAFLYGNRHSDDGKYGAWEFTMKRDSDFCVDADNKPTAAMEGKSTILKYFMEGQKASREGDVATMVAARNNIYRVFALSSIRAALKYAALMQYKNGEAKYSEEYHMEAYAYFLAAAGWVEQASPGTGKEVLALLDFKQSESELTANVYCEVRTKLIAAYAGLGLDCDLVGSWKQHNSTVLPCASTDACPASATVPQGITYEPTDSTASVGANMDCGAAFVTTTLAVEETSRAPSTTAGAALLLAALSSLLVA